MYPIQFSSILHKTLTTHIQLVHACFIQYKGIRLYSDVTVRNKVTEDRILTLINPPMTNRFDFLPPYEPKTVKWALIAGVISRRILQRRMPAAWAPFLLDVSPMHPSLQSNVPCSFKSYCNCIMLDMKYPGKHGGLQPSVYNAFRPHKLWRFAEN